MNRLKLIAFVIIATLYCFTAKAQETFIHIKADHVSYNKKLSTYYAYGNCTIYDVNYVLKADKVSYNETNSEAEAKGHVFIKDRAGNWVKGSYAIFNYSTYSGYIENAVLFIKSNHLYARAKRIIVLGKERYFIKKGAITSCYCPDFVNLKGNSHPKWSIEAWNTYVVKDRFLNAYPVIMKVRSVPVFFLPFIHRNLNKKRKTGFLMPHMGLSSYYGFKYIQPFFLNLGPSQDITFYPFIYTQRGRGIRSQYRFYWTKYSKGKWDITVYKEKIPYITSAHRMTRVNFKAKQYADLGRYGYLTYDVNIVNNRNNLRVIDMSNIETSSDRYTTSKASYYLNYKEYFFNAYAQFYQDLISQNNRATLQEMPVVKFGVINKKLYRNLTLDFKQTVSNDFRIEGKRGFYTDSTGFLSYPFKLSHFSITPKVGAHQIYSRWEIAPDSKDYTRRAFIPEYDLSLSTSLYGIFLNNSEQGFEGLKHTIKPTLSYQYIPERDQKFPDFVSVYSKTNKITLDLENIFTAKYIDNGKASYRQIFYNRITAYYDFAKEYHTPFPPIYEETTIKPFDFLKLTSKAHYFFKKHMFLDSSESLDVGNSKVGFTAGYNMSRDSDYNLNDESVNAKIYGYPLKGLYVYASFERSLHYSYYPSRKFGFLYSEDCWSVGLDFYLTRSPEEQDDGSYQTRLDRGFWLTLNLTGLFSIKREY